MAMVVYKAPLEQKSGKDGGNIYRSDNCGEHVQAYPRMIDMEPTPAQKKRRKCFRSSWLRFFFGLTHNQQQNWITYTNTHPVKNKKGESVILSPANMYMRHNINRCVEDLPWLDEPPN